MSELPPEIEEADVLLAQTARMDFAFARHVQQRALGADDVKELAELSRAYARCTRSLRQDLALLARQKAERAKAAREAAQPRTSVYPWEQPDPADERADELQGAVDRVISAAADGDHKLHADWCHRFDRELDDWTERPDWLDEPLDAQVLRAARTLGLPEDLAARWRDLPDPTFFPDPEPETPEEVAAATAAGREVLASLRAQAARRSPTGPRAPRVPWKDSS